MKISQSLKTVIILVLIIAFLFFLGFSGLSKEIKNVFYLISSPFQKILWKTGDRVSNFFNFLSEMKNLKKENEDLEIKNQLLISENTKLKELQKENETLREALKIGLEKDFQLVLAEVISKDPFEDSILINKGSKDGVLRGQAVITQGKVLCGRIGEVYDNFSKVILISNKENNFDARLQDREVYGLVKGRGNLALYLDLVPRDTEIREGELIMTTSLGGIFPKGLLVGEIKEIKKSDIKPFQEAEIKSAFKIEDLEILFVILNP